MRWTTDELNAFFRSANILPSEKAFAQLEQMPLDRQSAFVKIWFNWLKISSINSVAVNNAFESELEDWAKELLKLARSEQQTYEDF